jgi:hypothetical protein
VKIQVKVFWVVMLCIVVVELRPEVGGSKVLQIDIGILK